MFLQFCGVLQRHDQLKLVHVFGAPISISAVCMIREVIILGRINLFLELCQKIDWYNRCRYFSMDKTVV